MNFMTCGFNTRCARPAMLVLTWTAWSAFCLGVLWRATHIFYYHPATMFAYSDMLGFKIRTERLSTPYQETIADIILPPGGHMFFWLFYDPDPARVVQSGIAQKLMIDPRWMYVIVVQFILSCGVPLLLAAIGKEVYGRAVALVALLLASLYFPFIHYASHIMSEGPFLFFMLLSLWLLVRSVRAVHGGWSAGAGVAAGLALGVTTALKPVIVMPALLIGCWLILTTFRQWSVLLPRRQQMSLAFVLLAIAWAHALAIGGCLLFHATSSISWLILSMGGAMMAVSVICLGWSAMAGRGHRWSRWVWVLGSSSIGLLVVVAPLIIRATRLNENRFCFISTNGAVSALLGHYGDQIAKFKFRDRQRGYHFDFGYPVAYQRGYTKEMSLPFGAYDSDRILKVVWQWCADHPEMALTRSAENIFDLFSGHLPFPPLYQASERPWPLWYAKVTALQPFIWVLWCVILLPALLHVLRQNRALLSLEGAGLFDMLLVLCMVGLMITAFLTLGEPRYRVPFDALTMLLAARFFTWGVSRPDGFIPMARGMADILPVSQPAEAIQFTSPPSAL